jgi:mono/diheme cytochrome c family protein
MNRLKFYSVFLLAFGLVLLNACKDEEPVPENEDPIVVDATYTDDAAAILNSNCAFSGCHNSGASIGSLEGYTDAKAFAGFGKMIPAVKHESGVSPMPKNGTKLSDDDIATLEKWVADGLKE